MIICKENYCFERSTVCGEAERSTTAFKSYTTYGTITNIYNTPYSIVQHIILAYILICEWRRFF